MPQFDNLKFLHPVGVSTFRYGVTIPLEAQTERLRAIEKGGKVAVTILCCAEEPVMAEIRRLNNKPGHLQFRYSNKVQERLRLWLIVVFGGSAAGDLLEIVEVARITLMPKGKSDFAGADGAADDAGLCHRGGCTILCVAAESVNADVSRSNKTYLSPCSL